MASDSTTLDQGSSSESGQQFYDREKEMEFLADQLTSDHSEFIIIYGRRRVGKTALVKHFLRNKQGLYHLVSRESEKDQIEELKETASRDYPQMQELKNEWEVVLKEVGENYKILAIDEFQYLIETNKEILKILQKLWDQTWKNSDLMLLLTGSSIGMMETEVLGYKSPLYGRRTGQWHLKPFNFWQLRHYFPNYSKEDLVRTYAVLGGTPYYLEQFDRNKDVAVNIGEEILRKGAILREEAENLLQQELRQPKNYFSILKAISQGKTEFNEIRNETGVPRNSLSKYLQSLRNLHIIEKRLPVTASEKSKRGRYYIKDNYFSFWFRYVFPNRTMLEESWPTVLDSKIEPQLDLYTSHKFENICIDKIKKTGDYNKVGNWWYQDNEIDLVALNENERQILFGECKWSKSKVGKSVLKNLEATAQKVRWKSNNRRELFALFSRSGFSKNLKEIAGEREDLQLYELKDI